MDAQQLAFAKASRRFFRGAEWIARLPMDKTRLSRIWGRLASPYKADRPALRASFVSAFGVDEKTADVFVNTWLASHGLFVTSIFDYHRMDAAWVQQHVTISDPMALSRLRESGGLILSYHSHHHNTLGIVLGQSGLPIWGVAATEKASPMAPYTGRFMRIINGQSEAKFGGGKYLFTDEPRKMVLGLKEAFANHHGVVSICDNPAPAGEAPPVHFMGRSFHVGLGVVEMALAQGVPITLALLYPDLKGGYKLVLEPLPPTESAHQVVQSYFDFLASVVRSSPWAWQGWHWYQGLPAAAQ